MNISTVCSFHTGLFPALYLQIVDLSFWYSNGPGNSTTAAVGKGYVQELLSRLTQTTIPDANTTTGNSTLDGNPVTFPLNQPIYVDATHDTVSYSIFRVHPNVRASLLDHISNSHDDELYRSYCQWTPSYGSYSERPGAFPPFDSALHF